jgi:hypothetical protein
VQLDAFGRIRDGAALRRVSDSTGVFACLRQALADCWFVFDWISAEIVLFKTELKRAKDEAQEDTNTLRCRAEPACPRRTLAAAHQPCPALHCVQDAAGACVPQPSTSDCAFARISRAVWLAANSFGIAASVGLSFASEGQWLTRPVCFVQDSFQNSDAADGPADRRDSVRPSVPCGTTALFLPVQRSTSAPSGADALLSAAVRSLDGAEAVPSCNRWTIDPKPHWTARLRCCLCVVIVRMSLLCEANRCGW